MIHQHFPPKIDIINTMFLCLLSFEIHMQKSRPKPLYYHHCAFDRLLSHSSVFILISLFSFSVASSHFLCIFESVVFFPLCVIFGLHLCVCIFNVGKWWWIKIWYIVLNIYNFVTSNCTGVWKPSTYRASVTLCMRLRTDHRQKQRPTQIKRVLVCVFNSFLWHFLMLEDIEKDN